MGLLTRVADFFAPRVRTAEAANDKSREGVSGTVITGGYIESNEKNANLVGPQKYVTFGNTLLNTSIAAAGVRHFLNLVAGVSWRFNPADDSDRAKDLAEKMSLILDNTDNPWASIIRRQAMFKFMGFATQEKIAKKLTGKGKDGMVGLNVEQRPQKTIEQWIMDESRSVLMAVIQRDPQTGTDKVLARSRLFYSVDDAISDSPEGVGLLRHIVEPARKLARYETLEGYGFETDLRGVPVGYAPIALLNKLVKDKEISAEEAQKMLKGMTNFMNGHIKSPTLSLLMDSTPWSDRGENGTPISMRQWAMELLKTDSGAQEPVNTTIERLNREIARILGVEYLMLGGGDGGSHGLSEDKTQAFAALIQGTIDEIAQNVDRDIVPWVWERNGWPEDLMPKSIPDAVRLRNVQEVIDTLVKLAQAGQPMQPNDPAGNAVRRMINMPDAPEIKPEQLMLQAGLQQPQGGARPRGLGAGAPPGSGSGGAPGGLPRAPKPQPAATTATAKFGEPVFLKDPPKGE